MVNLCISFDIGEVLLRKHVEVVLFCFCRCCICFLLFSFFFSLLFILSTNPFSYRYSEGGDESDARFFGLFSGAGVPARPTGDVVDTETIYKMNRATRGIAVIINNKNFLRSSGMDKYARRGTDVDRNALAELFMSLKFEVRIHNDVTKSGIERIAKEMATFDHSNYDAFIFSILTHGKEGLLYGTDGTISTRDLTSVFKDATTLSGKPKMFFFQACQGKKLLVPSNVYLISSVVPLSLSQSCANWFVFVLLLWKLFFHSG